MSEQREGPSGAARPEWLPLGVVGLTAIVLSLIGFAVASRYEPSSDPFAAPSTTEAPTTTSPSADPTTTTVPVGTTGGATRATTTTDAGRPAKLTLSTDAIDFGLDRETIEVEIVNEGGRRAAWVIETGDPAVKVDPGEGEIGPGDRVAVRVSIDRSELAEGEFESSLELSWPDGDASADVTAVVQDNPIIHEPRVSPATIEVGGGGGCSPTRTTVSARVRDTSELDRVIVRWSPDGTSTRETAMDPAGNDIYEGVIGPYEAVRTDSVKVVAFDVRGNAGGASVALSVVACS